MLIFNSEDFNSNTISQEAETFTFYKVAYRNQESFVIPNNVKDSKKLNAILQKLNKEVLKLTISQQGNILNLLNEIAYLFKSTEYQYEDEVRLVVKGVGIKKIISKETVPPKVFISLIDIVPVLHKITLGPKVEKADE